MNKWVYSFSFNQTQLVPIASVLKAKIGTLEHHSFPDQETYLRVMDSLEDAEVILWESLNNPDPKLLKLIYFSETVKALGAKKVILVAPYLAYMRQDKRFKSGECLSAPIFAKLICDHFDELVTVDPHLHRYKELSAIYSIPTHKIGSSRPISAWIKNNIKHPFLIGPDDESRQWVEEIARFCDAPFTISAKKRLGDRRVKISVSHLEAMGNRTPVLIDDIISSGQTILETVKVIKNIQEIQQPTEWICIRVHAIFADKTYQQLCEAGLKVYTCNSIPHVSNTIDLVSEIVEEFIPRK